MKNDIEKIRAAVLAYCEELDKEGTRLCMIHKGFTLVQKVGNAWTVTIGSKIFWLDEGFEGWHFLYAALGLEARDAVAPYKSENERLQSAWMAEKARNTALVEALEKIKQEHGYRYTYGDGFGNVVEKRINSVGVAVDNALTANTEKGGANE